MKNIHILPTDKPSSLYLNSYNELQIRSNIIRTSEDYLGSNQHIYITSDKEIKEGDWVYTPNKTTMLVTVKYSTESSFMIGNNNNEKSPYYIEFCKKIILTTDQDLINDGVQKIDDEFLQWFVKNPSCEEVEIRKEMYIPQSNGKISDGKITHEISLEPSQNTLPYYKIIIPKEEPKQERMYSEEDMLEFTKYLLSKKITKAKSISDLEEYLPKEFQLLSGELMRNGKELISEWFEQFKKKQDGKSKIK